MKMSFRLFTAVIVLAFTNLVFADDFQSMVIGTGATVSLPRIHGNEFMVIRNFTQDDFVSTRGFVTVTRPPNGGTPVNVLTAASLDASPPDIINTVTIAGAADVSVTCGDTTGNCFISYRKGGN